MSRSPIESLESRQHLSTTKHPARVDTFFLDNRGGATLTFNAKLNASTVTKKNALIYTAGSDKKLGTADDKQASATVSFKNNVLTLSAKLSVNTSYRVLLKHIKDANGFALDGEFAGSSVRSGNGTAGGDFDVIASRPKTLTNYRYTTSQGNIDITLFTDTPKSWSNFQHYANEGAWDTTFFHRSTRDASSGIQVIQGGGFNVNSTAQIGSVHADAPIPLELKHSNVKGTLAMARTGDPTTTTTATNQWFFNVNDNTTLDSAGGGYTVFGKVSNSASQAVIEKINNLTIRQGDPTNAQSAFNELPSTDATGTIDVPKDLVLITRVAARMDLKATKSGTASSQAFSSTRIAAAAEPAASATPTKKPTDLVGQLTI